MRTNRPRNVALAPVAPKIFVRCVQFVGLSNQILAALTTPQNQPQLYPTSYPGLSNKPTLDTCNFEIGTDWIRLDAISRWQAWADVLHWKEGTSYHSIFRSSDTSVKFTGRWLEAPGKARNQDNGAFDLQECGEGLDRSIRTVVVQDVQPLERVAE